MVFSSNSQKLWGGGGVGGWWCGGWCGGMAVVGGVIRLSFQSNSNSQNLSLGVKKIIVDLIKGFYMGCSNPSGWVMIFFYTKVTIFENLMEKLDSCWSS